MKNKKIIRIVGNIGAGKSTLLKYLKQKRPSYFILNEPVKTNPLLSLFYRESEKWGMHLQVFMEDAYYLGIVNSSKNLILTDFGQTRVFTQTLYKHLFLDEMRFKILTELSKKYTKSLPEPVYFFIKTCPETCLERIKQRDRLCEQDIKLNYLQDLDFFYKKFLEEKKESGAFVYSFSENFEKENALKYLEYIEKNIFKIV